MRVLLLEAGERLACYSVCTTGTDHRYGTSPLSNPTSRIPAMYSQFFHTQYDYEIYTVPQEHAYNKRKFWPRGRYASRSFHCTSTDTPIWRCQGRC